MKFLLDFLERHDRKRVIMDRQSKEPYLERYYLFLKDRKSFPFNVFLHKFLRSDPDDLHDHPWPYATLILKGGYWEWVPTFNESKEIIGEQKIWRGPGHFRTCKATSYHRIEVEPGVDCWTLFMPGPQQREWGFRIHYDWEPKSGMWIPHEDYIAQKSK
jgi:hypothetical protein